VISLPDLESSTNAAPCCYCWRFKMRSPWISPGLKTASRCTSRKMTLRLERGPLRSSLWPNAIGIVVMVDNNTTTIPKNHALLAYILVSPSPIRRKRHRLDILLLRASVSPRLRHVLLQSHLTFIESWEGQNVSPLKNFLCCRNTWKTSLMACAQL
jgi:hypothetical protein